MGKDTCRNFRQAWMDTVPLIVAIAKKRKLAAINLLFCIGRFQNIDTDFGRQNVLELRQIFIIWVFFLKTIRLFPFITIEARSTLALELLPLLVTGKHKGAKARRYFIDHRDVSPVSSTIHG